MGTVTPIARTPLHAPQAEIDLLGHVMSTASCIEYVPAELRAEHFYSEANRQIFAVVLAEHAKGREASLEAVLAELRRRKRFAQAGEVALENVRSATGSPYPSKIREAAERIIETYRARRLSLDLQRMTGRLDAGELDAPRAAAALRVLADAQPGLVGGPYEIERAAELAEPLPALAWLCRGLNLARASVSIVGGYGFSRKTLYAQSLGLAIATGTRALGVYEVDRQPVLHIDFEQGKRITRERYQRMARAAGVDLREAQLSVVTFPKFNLTSTDARDTMRRLLEESRAAFVVIDSLKGATPGIDENSSEIREGIDLVGQECKRVDAAGLLIHHARKPAEGRAAGRYSLRGSSGIFDAVDSAFIFSGEKGQTTIVEHEKDRLLGTVLGTFGITSEDVQGADGDPRWGLRVVHHEAAQMREQEERASAARADVTRDKAMSAIVSFLSRHGGSFSGSKTQLRDATAISRPEFFAALTELTTCGRVVMGGTQRDRTIELRGGEA